MKICTYQKRSPFDATAYPGQPCTQERLTFEAFKAIHGGEATHTPANHFGPPAGFSLWRTAKGEVLAIRDEG